MTKAIQKKPVDMLKNIINSESIQRRIKDAFKESAGKFTISVIEVFSGDSYLQKCDPALVVQEALKAASLNLPITKSLGLGYIVPYKGKPSFQIGYKGLLQLAQRSGQMKVINDGPVYEGEAVTVDRLSGEIKIEGEIKNDVAIGYFAYFKLINGYEKAEYWTKEKVTAHAKKYSASYKSKNKIWVDEFDKQASKTVLSHILNKYAPKSVDFLMNDPAETVVEDEVYFGRPEQPAPTKTTKEMYEEQQQQEPPPASDNDQQDIPY